MKNIKRPGQEGFIQNDSFLEKTGTDLYDDFYTQIYDHLVFSDVKNDYEVGEILDKTTPTTESNILDVGSGTGHHVGRLTKKGFNVTGVDASQAMVDKAKSNYPSGHFLKADIQDPNLFNKSTFTHVLCMYFTVYYIKDKNKFFRDCFQWLKPGGYFIVHLVDHSIPFYRPAIPCYTCPPKNTPKNASPAHKSCFTISSTLPTLKWTRRTTRRISTRNSRTKKTTRSARTSMCCTWRTKTPFRP